MTKNAKATSDVKAAKVTEKSPVPTKHQQIIDLLSRDGGATLEEMSTLAGWLTHSTRAFLTGLKKKGYAVISNKVDGIRCYRITGARVA
jgi:DNA-binding IclR family transcriptional regulator